MLLRGSNPNIQSLKERDPRAHKEKKKRAPTRRLPSGERFTASAFNVCVCVCVCVFVRRGREDWLVGWLVSSFFDGLSKTKREEEEEEEERR